MRTKAGHAKKSRTDLKWGRGHITMQPFARGFAVFAARIINHSDYAMLPTLILDVTFCNA
jgi:hypothetical protein